MSLTNILAVFCENLPNCDSDTCSSTASEAARDPETQLFPYRTTFEYACRDELKFYDGTQSMYVSCGADAEWSEEDVSCRSEFDGANF